MEDGGPAPGQSFDRLVAGPERRRHGVSIAGSDGVVPPERHDPAGTMDANRLGRRTVGHQSEHGMREGGVEGRVGRHVVEQEPDASHETRRYDPIRAGGAPCSSFGAAPRLGVPILRRSSSSTAAVGGPISATTKTKRRPTSIGTCCAVSSPTAGPTDGCWPGSWRRS